MRRTIQSLAVAVAMTATAATAADLGGMKDDGYGAYQSPAMWSGFYMGAHVGYGWSGNDWTLIRNAGNSPSNQIGTVITSHDADDWLGGVQIGFNHQSGQFVIGAEGEFSWTGMKGSSTWTAQGGPNAGAYRDATTEINWLATLTARAGMTFDRALIYAKGGVAWSDADYSHTGGAIGTPRFLTDSATSVGWILGAGIEYAMDANWSLKAEYNYLDFGDVGIAPTDGVRTALFDVEQDIHAFKIGLNYRFGARHDVESLK